MGGADEKLDSKRRQHYVYKRTRRIHFCRCYNDVLHSSKGGQGLLRGAPVEGTHGKVVVVTLPDSKLISEILKGKEFMRSVKLLIVLAVAALHLTIVSRRKWPDELVRNAELGKRCFK